MNEQSDQQLLRNYAEHQSEVAFTEIVRRHADLVHSAALRMVCDAHLAKDVTQSAGFTLPVICTPEELMENDHEQND